MNPDFSCDRSGCRVSGNLVLKDLDSLSERLLQHAEQSQDMSLNLKQVSDCDSAFVALLMACLQIKKQQNLKLRISGYPDKLVALFEVYGLSDSGVLKI